MRSPASASRSGKATASASSAASARARPRWPSCWSALYQPQAGSILIDGTDIRAIDPADLRRAVGYLPQNIVLFAGSVRDNLLVGAPGADDAAILRAASIAGLIDIVNRHPKGFDMPVGERGEALSGGQRQTVALARALITDPPILVLDEPTHAMDHSAEERLKAQMQAELAGKTILIITHRESLLSVVNTLVVMDGGRVVAVGPKDAGAEGHRRGQGQDGAMSEIIDVAHETMPKPKPPLLPPAWRPEELAADDGGLKRSPHWLLAAHCRILRHRVRLGVACATSTRWCAAKAR